MIVCANHRGRPQYAKGLCKSCYQSAYYYAKKGRSRDAVLLNRITIERLVPIGENIHGRRIHLGWTQEKLADQAGIAEYTIMRIARGESEGTVASLYALAAALQCEAWELLKPGHFPLVRAA